MRFKTMEQRLDQLEQTKHATPTDVKEDAERSTRAVPAGFPPDTTEATIKKFFLDVLQQGSLAGQVTQIRCTADPTTHSERNHFVKTMRPSHHVGEGSTRPIQFHEDLSGEERNIPKHFGYHIHCEMGIELSHVFIDRKTKSQNVTREIVAKTHPEVSEARRTYKSATNQRRGLYAVITAQMEQNRPVRARLQAVWHQGGERSVQDCDW